MYAYSICSNIFYIGMPGLFYATLASRNWGTLLVRIKILCVFSLFLSMIIVNAMILNKISESYRYCYGSLKDDCEDYEGDLDYDLTCEKSTNDPYYVVCINYSSTVLEFSAIGFNLVPTVMMLPYLLFACSLKRILSYHSVMPINDEEPSHHREMPLYIFEISKFAMPQK
eukprot:CAMPEP_0204910356 /NCGR_PEP_ID=MMETSP1397-20131031/8903_1 /ASSEMBLY_ACC=CAM_ASM_000891 /TAXON_ID=49980 /ORGANISM="Climacostomum Climacostomum virens, Strain Stock W-24" /LENGTH=169 /DNA_ID=CAMNT_0052080491 /DNA_START=106 /DNA_END=615 /DNA_ORIENTATION=-